MIQIATASQEQTTGMDQVAVAIQRVKMASLQHLEGMKQIERAARQLDQLGQTLKTLTDQYTSTSHMGSTNSNGDDR